MWIGLSSKPFAGSPIDIVMQIAWVVGHGRAVAHTPCASPAGTMGGWWAGLCCAAPCMTVHISTLTKVNIVLMNESGLYVVGTLVSLSWLHNSLRVSEILPPLGCWLLAYAGIVCCSLCLQSNTTFLATRCHAGTGPCLLPRDESPHWDIGTLARLQI